MEDESLAQQHKPDLYVPHNEDGQRNTKHLSVFFPSTFAVEAIINANQLLASVPQQATL